MTAYKYTGYDVSGKKVSGEIVVSSIEEAERKVAAQEITIITIVPAGMKKIRVEEETPERRQFRRKGRVSDADSALILQNLAVMAETGVPFVEAVDAVVASARTPLIASALSMMRDDIVGGKSLSASIRSASYLFPSIVADMVKVAEEGGRLDQALRAAGGYLERAAELRKRVINALLYPCVMLGVSCLTVCVLVVFVLPKFADIFEKMGAELPITTKWMLAFGTSLRSQPLMTIGAIVGGLFVLRMLLKLPAVNELLGKAMLRMPILGDLLKKLALSRAFQSIATLLSSNVALISALEHGAKVSGIPNIRDALLYSREAVEQGRPLSDALSETRVFPPIFLQMISIGERTGRLSHLLGVCSTNMEQEVDARLKALVSIVEPLMIVFMGLVVGTITVSIIGPIYSVVQNIK